MEVQQQKKRRYCDCGFETTALSDYHTAEHQKSKRHRQAMTANKMQRLDSYFSKAAAAHKDTPSQHFKGPQSDCEYFYKFSLASAAKGTTNSPCTNIPMLCQESQCSQVHWKYNMTTHFQDRHSNSILPDAFKISSVEKSRVLKAGKFEKSKP